MTSPRYEFRTFVPIASPRGLERRLASLLGDGRLEHDADVYVFVSGQLDTNVKLRHGRLDVKELIDVHGRLERWRPVGDAEFPLGERWLRFLSTRCGFPMAVSGNPDLDSFLDAAERSPEVRVAHASKRRRKFADRSLSGEVATTRINGALVTSVTLESEDSQAVLEAMSALGMEAAENVSFPKALQRLFGLVPLPPGDPARIDPNA